MRINIRTDFSEERDENEIELVIKAKEQNEEVNAIIDGVQKISKDISIIVAEKDNKVYILNDDIYRVKKRLYDLEEMLKNKYFLRISNSCIINVKQVECFDMGKVRKYCC